MKQLNNAVFVFTKTRRNEVPVSFAKYLYYILNNSAILLADSILPHNWRPRILPDMGLVLIINSNISFHFRLFPRKTNDQFFKKSKDPILGLWGYFGLLLPKFEQRNFPGKRLRQFLNIPIIYHRAKNQKKLIWHSWGKCWNDGWMDRNMEGRTDSNDFAGPSLGQGFNY